MRDYGIKTGIFKTGKYNAITDVPGVTIGQVTKIEGEDVRTGVTAIIPHQGNIYQNKIPAAIYVGNGMCVEALSTSYGVVYQRLRTTNAIMVCRPNI